MQFLTGTADALQSALIADLGRYRHKVFIEMLGWDPLCDADRESDQYDHPDTLYVIGRNQDAELVACARLLPTTRPYLLSEQFPQLLQDVPAPQTPEVWELSRFAAVNLKARHHRRDSMRQFSSPEALALLKECMASAAQRGAKHLVSVSPMGVERLLNANGIAFHRAGPPRIVNGQRLFACWISIRNSSDQ